MSDTSQRRGGSFEVHLDVFEGPFQLLLTLISERRLDVCDVPIATLTEDYLAYLDQMRGLDLEVTTEFLVVAATLLQLKARSLLPVDAEVSDELHDDVDRDVLIARLLEVRTFQASGALLAERLASGDLLHPPAPASDDPALRVLPTLANIAAEDLARSLVALLADRARPVDTATLFTDEVSTEAAAAELLQALAHRSLRFRELATGRSLQWAIALFLAVLELAMRGEVHLGSGERLGDVEIELSPAGQPRGTRGDDTEAL